MATNEKENLKYYKLVCEDIPSRMHRKDKMELRKQVCEIAKKLGFDFHVESNKFAKNVVIGNPDTAEIIVGAHYDTPPRLPKWLLKNQWLVYGGFLGLAYVLNNEAANLAINYIKPEQLDAIGKALTFTNAAIPSFVMAYMLGFAGGANKTNYNDNSSGVLSILNLMYQYKDLPLEEKNKMCFVLFDNEEKGLFGSISYAIKHRKAIKNQTMINLDCVGRGKNIKIYHRKNGPGKIAKLVHSKFYENKVFVPEYRKNSFFEASDHVPFFKSKENIMLITNEVYDPDSLLKTIHSSNDTYLEKDNIKEVVKVVKSVIDETVLKKETNINTSETSETNNITNKETNETTNN